MSSCDTLARCAVELRRQRRHELADIVRALCICVSRDNGDALLAEIRGHVFDTLQRQPEEKVACAAPVRKEIAVKKQTIAIAAALLATAATPVMASGPTPADVAAFSAAAASLPDTKEIKREQASGNLTNFTSSARRVMDVVVTVAERDYPQIIADWKVCLRHTEVTSPSYQTQCRRIGNQVNPILESEWNALSRASEARP